MQSRWRCRKVIISDCYYNKQYSMGRFSCQFICSKVDGTIFEAFPSISNGKKATLEESLECLKPNKMGDKVKSKYFSNKKVTFHLFAIMFNKFWIDLTMYPCDCRVPMVQTMVQAVPNEKRETIGKRESQYLPVKREYFDLNLIA